MIGGPSLLTEVGLARSIDGGAHLASESVWVAHKRVSLGFKFLVEAHFTVDLFLLLSSGQIHWRRNEKEMQVNFKGTGYQIKPYFVLLTQNRVSDETGG